MRSILEVWDYRLSTAQPINYKGAKGIPGVPDSDNWVAVVYDQGDRNEPLEVHDTGIRAEAGPEDCPGLDACYAFYRTVRDKYSRPNIEELKPQVKVLREQQLAMRAATDSYNEKQREITHMGGQ